MEAIRALKTHAEAVKQLHLRSLLQDTARTAGCVIRSNDLLFDYSHSLVTQETVALLETLATDSGLFSQIAAMRTGEQINSTEHRSVLHTLLRAEASQHEDFPSVLETKQRVKTFAEAVRTGAVAGCTGHTLRNVLCIGIGGSYLGPEFVAEFLRTDPRCTAAASGRSLRFLANVDPVDFLRATEGLSPESTLVVVISKTFTTAETMLNAKKAQDWLVSHFPAVPAATVIAAHMCAVSTNLERTAEFGISAEKVFGFWDWVGGRFSVTSAVGLLPLFLQFGEYVEQFLVGARTVDTQFFSGTVKGNVPIMLGLLGWWNTECLGFTNRALLPYSQALLRFPAHVQQLDMESNGKQCNLNGERVLSTGPVVFGEPGTNGQHSFYQLMHQGRVVPAEFVGFCRSHSEDNEAHDELMSNFFAQPDALAIGKTQEELLEEACPKELIPHKVFYGNRPSLSLLFGEMNAFNVGQLLATYEHRVAVEGFLWGINSFDQFGVELGKGLAGKVKRTLRDGAVAGHPSEQLLQHYLDNRRTS